MSTSKFLIFLITILTLFGIKTHAQTAGSILQTVPSGAEVLDESKKKLGNTPFDLTKLGSNRTLLIASEGYDSTAITFPEKNRFGIQYPQSIASCNPPCFMDFNSVNDACNGPIKLWKKLPEYDRAIMISIDTPVIVIPKETVIGKVNGSKKQLNDRDINILIGYTDNMDIQIINSFENSYIEAEYLTIKNKEKTNLYNPKIIFKPEIINLDFNLKGRLLRDYTGPMLMNCVWKISTLTNPKEVIASVPVKTTLYRTGDNYNLLLQEMIAASEYQLLNNDTLYKFLIGIERDYLHATKGAVFEVKVPKQKSFATSKEMLKGVTNSVVTIANSEGFGSGVIISDDGYIITNHHVVADEKNVTVKLSGDKKVKAEIVKTNTDYDLALLKIPVENLSALSFGKSTSEAGDEVFAIGTPLEKSLSQTVTKGIISGYREWNGVTFIQTDVSINPGNSGGPLINDKGEIIGIATMKYTGKGIEGIGFCIPTNEIIEMLNLKLK